MPTLEEIQNQIKHLDAVSKIFAFKEIKALPDILWDDELLERVVQGIYNNRMGILCATNKRLLFVEKGFFYGVRVEDFPYDKITSIQYKTGIVMGEVTIFASGNRAKISHIEKNQARDFGDYVRARTTKTTEHASAPPTQASETPTIDQRLNALEKLAKLKEMGVLSDEEFQMEKKKLMR